MKNIQSLLTNENLKGKFKNNFDLANFAILLAKEHLVNGEPLSLSVIMNELATLTKDEERKIVEGKIDIYI